jgi:hypothetical protein
MTTTDVALREPGNGVVSREWIALLEPAAALANQVAGSAFVPTAMRNNPAAIVAAILYGDELGLGPMQSLAKINVIEGKPSLSAEAQRALILAEGHELWVDESTATRVTVSGRRRDSERTSSVTWTLDDAKRANLAGKQNWRLYPRQMLMARATADLARAIFADVIGGLAATEEIEDVDPLALGEVVEAPAEKKTTRRRRTTNKPPALVAPADAEVEGAGETPSSPDLPPLPDETADSLVEPDRGVGDKPPVSAPPDPAEVPLESTPETEDARPDEPGEVAQDDETTASSVTSESSDVASPAQLIALNALVGILRTTEVELEDGTKSVVLSTAQLWAATATRRNVDVDTMIELLGGRDDEGVLHWSPLRDSLTGSEASDLMLKLSDRAQKWGVS